MTALALPAGQVAHLDVHVDLALLLPPSSESSTQRSTLLDDQLSIGDFDTLSLGGPGRGRTRERPEITTVTGGAVATLKGFGRGLVGALFSDSEKATAKAFKNFRRVPKKITKSLAPGFVGDAGLGQRLSYDPLGLASVGDVVTMPDLDVLSYEWTRNPLSEPDELELTVSADSIPGDLQVLRGIQVDAWLFTHRDRTKLRRGQPGYFGGIVSDVTRNRETHEITLSCVDYTWVMGSVQISKDVVNGIRLDAPLIDVVRRLVDAVPGAESWEVEDRSDRLRLIVGNDTVGGLFTGPVSKVVGAKTLGHLIGKDAGISYWTAIVRLCALVGAVPEFTHSVGGQPTVVLLAADQAQGGSLEALQDRGGRRIRRLTVGLDVIEPVESLSFDSGNKVDAVQVRCQDPDTGEIYKGTAGRDGRKSITSDRIQTHVAYGLTSSAECERYAAEIWRSQWQGEFGLSVATGAPWTTGGGPDGRRQISDAEQDFAARRNTSLAGTPTFGASDLLSAQSGEAIEIEFAGFEAAASAFGTPERALTALFRRSGMSAEHAQRLAVAHQRLALSTVFQIHTLTHSYSDAEYSCSIDLHAFIDAPEDELVIFDDPLDLPSAGLGGL